jgi:hypothetical protein
MSDAPDKQASLETVLCFACKYDVSGLPVGGRCPECGTRVIDAALVKRHHGMAKAALILGILSLLTWWIYFLLPALLGFTGLLLARRAKREIRGGKGAVASVGMATAAEACCWVALSFAVVFLGILVIAWLAYLF